MCGVFCSITLVLVMEGGSLRAVTVREPDVAFTKTFLVSGLERVQLLEATPQTILESPTEIRRWIEANLPLKGERRVATKAKRASGDPFRSGANASGGQGGPTTAAVVAEGCQGFRCV